MTLFSSIHKGHGIVAAAKVKGDIKKPNDTDEEW